MLSLTWRPPVPQSFVWHLSHTWFSTEPPLSWLWIEFFAALPWLPVLPHTAPVGDHSHDGQTARHGLEHF